MEQPQAIEADKTAMPGAPGAGAAGDGDGPAGEGVPVTLPRATDASRAPIDDNERAGRLHQLRQLVDLMRPAVQADGGDLVLVAADVEAGTVEVQLQGACSSCAISSATLQGGVERILKDRLPWITEVRGGVTEDVDDYESAALGQGGYVPRF